MQHEKVRAMTRCICCGGTKDVGLLLCWPCHHKEKRGNDGGYSKTVEQVFDLIEEGYIIDNTGRVHRA